MTEDELLDMLAGMVPAEEADDEDAMGAQLSVAEAALVTWMYPYRDDATWADVPAKYHVRAVEIANYLMARRGAEGETSHSENGTSRTWGSAHIPLSMLQDIPPKAGVPA